MSVVEATPAEPSEPDAATGPSTRPTAPWWSLPGAWYPVVVFAVWRVAQGAVTWWLGGRLVESAYTYDGAHYLRILHHGYMHPRPSMPSHAFFPGLAWLATPVRWLTGSDAVTVHVTATATGVAAFIAVWGVTKAWTDERTARLAVVLLALFPSSLFLWAFYSEALFIALGAGAVWADRRGKRWVAALCFAGIATTRSVGIVIPAVIVLARIIRQRRIDRWAVAYALSGLAGPRSRAAHHARAGRQRLRLHGRAEGLGPRGLVAVGLGGAGHRQPHAQVRHGDGARPRGPQPRPLGRGHRGDRHRLPRRCRGGRASRWRHGCSGWR